MAIFIGRNIEDNTKMWLNQRRVDFVEQPLIDIRLNTPNASFLHGIDAKNKSWVLSSKWAVNWLLRYHNQIGFESGEKVFCISAKQALALKQITSKIFISEQNNSESLSKLVKEKCEEELRIFLKGNRSRQITADNAFEVVVYINTLLTPCIEEEYDAYLFFSPSGIESFVYAGNQIPANADIIVIGETTAKMARNKFKNEVVVSDSPNELAMLKLAVVLQQKKELNAV
jgi:uroporphyrinogen-III synthase